MNSFHPFVLLRRASSPALACARRLSLVACTLVALSPTAAFAQGARPSPTPAAATPATSTTTTGEYAESHLDGASVVVFKEDVMGGGNANPLGDTIRRPPGALRVGLLRPRFNFVGEMLKSVENL